MQPCTSVPGREKGHCAGQEHHAREEAAWPGHSGQPAASSVHSPGHPWMWSEGNSAAGSSPHPSVTASTLHQCLSAYILNVQEDGVQEMGSQQPPGTGAIIISGWLQQHCRTGNSIVWLSHSHRLRALPV